MIQNLLNCFDIWLQEGLGECDPRRYIHFRADIRPGIVYIQRKLIGSNVSQWDSDKWGKHLHGLDRFAQSILERLWHYESFQS